jgi:hypothetical protein
MFREFQDVLGAVSSLRGLRGNQEDPMEMENLALRNIKLRRELSQPSSIELEQIRMQQAQAKDIFQELKDLALDNSLPQSTRTHYSRMLEFHAYNLPDTYRKILQPLMGNTPLDEREQKKRYFEKYGPPEPTAPRAQDGSILPSIPENEQKLAEYQIAKNEYNKQKNIFLFGKDYADAVKDPKFVQPVNYYGDGENRIPGDFWYRDEHTGEITNVSPNISMISQKELAEKGWTMARVKATGMIPAPGAETVMANYGGIKTQITPVLDLKTGEQKFDVYNYGKPDESFKALPKDFLAALGELRKGTDFEDIKDNSVSNLVGMLTDFEEAYKKNPDPAALNTFNRDIQTLYPEARDYRFVLGPKNYRDPWWRGMLKVPGTYWSIIPATTTMTVNDNSGNPVTLYKDKNNRAYDATGRRVPGADNKEEGDLVPEITLKPRVSDSITETDINSDKTIGTQLVKLADYLEQPQGEAIRKRIQAEFLGQGEPVKVTGEDIKRIARDTGLAVEFLADLFFYAPINEIASYLRGAGELTEAGVKKLTNTILNMRLGE